MNNYIELMKEYAQLKMQEGIIKNRILEIKELIQDSSEKTIDVPGGRVSVKKQHKYIYSDKVEKLVTLTKNQRKIEREEGIATREVTGKMLYFRKISN